MTGHTHWLRAVWTRRRSRLSEARRRNRDATRELEALMATLRQGAGARSGRPGWVRLASG